MSENCKKIQRKLGRYIDNELSAGERMSLEAHLKECIPCAVEKQEMERLTSVFHQIPDIIPSEQSENLFWEKVRQAEKHGLMAKISSFISWWNNTPVFYPAAVALLFGMVMGVAFNKVYNVTSHQNKLHYSAIEYLALNRMDAIPYSSFAGVYGAGHSKQKIDSGEK